MPNGPRRKIPRSRHLDLDGLGRFSPASAVFAAGLDGKGKSVHYFLFPCAAAYMGVSKNRGQIIHFNRVFHYKSSILGYPYFWIHPYIGDV